MASASRQSPEVLAEEQAALRRVATLVARGLPAPELFAAVTEEVARLLGADMAGMSRYDGDDTQTIVAAWPAAREHLAVGTRLPLSDGTNLAQMVRDTGRPARIDDWARTPGPIAAFVRQLGVRSSVASPIMVGGRLWGVMIVDSRGPEPLPTGTEDRLASFTQLVATAVANGEAQAELRRLADEQSALRRVATLVARGLQPDEGLAVVAEEVGRTLGAEIVHLGRFDADGGVTTVASWSERGIHLPAGTRLTLDGDSATALVLRTGRPARVDDYTDVTGSVPDAMRARGIRSAVGCPIVVEGRVWGAMVVASTRPGSQPADTEAHLAAFTELVATAVANAHAGGIVAKLADEQAALRRVATLVARESSPEALFAAVGEEVGLVLGADVTNVLRYDADGTATAVAGWSTRGNHVSVGTRLTLEGDSVTARVHHSGRAARMDSYARARGSAAALLRERGISSAVGAPIVVAGRLWGVVIAGSSGVEHLPPDTESHIAEFTELVATAIANADSRAQLASSRARVVAAGDEARRRIERNLHDGAQQRLVSLGLRLRALEAAPPDSSDELQRHLSAAVRDVTDVLEDLQEISRGLHPGHLAAGGLEPALAALAARSAIPVELDLNVPARLPERVEVAAYYVAAEALANAAKHARASTIRIGVEAGETTVVLVVRDDGIGGADPASGSGLIGLSDRVEAIGGTLEIVSPAGAGTVLSVRLPTAPSAG